MSTKKLSSSSLKNHVDRTWLTEIGTAEDPYRRPKVTELAPKMPPLPICRDKGPQPGAYLVDDESVSTRHAEIRYRAALFQIVDLDSTNGTYVNGYPCKPGAPHPLNDGDTIQTGGTFFRFRTGLFDEASIPKTITEDDRLRSVCPEFLAEVGRLRAAAVTTAPVLIQGETGVGKEVFARRIHELSKRPGKYVPVNTAGLQAGLIPAELFGVVEGAHSKAEEERLGLIRTADRGTVLLDEIGDMPLEVQPALLRIIQESEVFPVGSDEPREINVRFIAATHRNPDDTGLLRQDLVARLRAISINIPSLRDRIEDLGLLIGRILRQLGANDIKFAPDAYARMCLYGWPENVRQLYNFLSYVATEKSGEITVDDLEIAGVGPRKRSEDPDEEWSQEYINTLLREFRGCIQSSANALGVHRMKLSRYLDKVGIDPNKYRPTPRKRRVVVTV